MITGVRAMFDSSEPAADVERTCRMPGDLEVELCQPHYDRG